MRKAISVILGILVIVGCDGQGTQGPAGKDGITPRLEVLQDSSGLEIRVCYQDSCGPWYFLPAGSPGLDGRDGKDGKNGQDGKDGKDGQPGISVDTAKVYSLLRSAEAKVDSLERLVNIKPPMIPVGYIQTSYLDGDGLRTYVLSGDSLMIRIHPSFVDVQGNPLDSLLFHVCSDSVGKGKTLLWTPYFHPGDTIDVILKGCPMGDFQIAVRQGELRDERYMSSFAYSGQSGWKVKRVK